MTEVDQGLCITSGMFGLKLVCWQKVDILNTKYDANCDKNSSDFDCLKMLINLLLCNEMT